MSRAQFPPHQIESFINLFSIRDVPDEFWKIDPPGIEISAF